MFGLEDPQIWLAYLLCILAAVFAVVYGVTHWNKGDEDVSGEDKKWVEGEREASDEF
jgi:hypothetical protein